MIRTTPGPGYRGVWHGVAQALHVELQEGTTGLLGVWQDLAREHGLQIDDVSGDVVKAVNDAAQRVSRYRMRVLTLEELEELGVGMFLTGTTYEAWRGNTAIVEPVFTREKLELAMRILKYGHCPMRDCEDFDFVQREVPEHVTDEMFEIVQRGAEEYLDMVARQREAILNNFGVAFQRQPTGYRVEEIVTYVNRALGEPDARMRTAAQQAQYGADLLLRVQRLMERCREPDGRPDRVTIAAEIAAWMAHPQTYIFAENAARHRDAARRRWDEHMRRTTAPPFLLRDLL